VSLGKASLTSLLSGFGPGVGDLLLKAGQMTLSGAVTLPTHMLHNSVSANVEDSGEIVIADLPKVLTFLKSLPKDALVTLWQLKNKPLKLISGKTELVLPTTEYIKSTKGLDKATAMVSEAETAHWKSWDGRALPCYGRAKGQDFYQLKAVDKVLGSDVPIKAEFTASESVWTLHMGHKSAAQMSVGIDLDSCDGPSEPCVSHYSNWLPAALQSVPAGPVELYTDHDYVAILRHVEKDYLLVVLNMRGE